MNPVLENMKKRRSIRKFSDEAVSREALDSILEAALLSPTAMNRQERRYTVIGREDIKKVEAVIGALRGNPEYTVYNADRLIIVSCDREAENGRQDSACAMMAMMLAASSLDLGSCWINQFRSYYDTPELRPLLREFSIPDEHAVYAALAVGHADEVPAPLERTEEIVFIG